MLIFAIDDEPKMLRLLHKSIAEAAPDAEIRDYLLGSEALAAVEESGRMPDVVFSDIQMPGVTGLELAVRFKQISPNTAIVFVTGYDYALDAYRLHVGGYIMKPVDPQRVREELDNLFPAPAGTDKLRVQCFGPFEVFWQNKPLLFSRKQSKELLALLVDRRGAACSSEEVIAVLWEDAEDQKSAKQRLRNLVNDLKATLRSVGAEQVLIRQGSRLAIRPDLLECDYYRMLEGDMASVNAFRGQYMEQYSWAEITKGSLYFQRIRG